MDVNTMLFVVLPYVSLILASLAGLRRYYGNRYSYSSLSTQILEHRMQFWGSIPWHYGIIAVLLVHLWGGTLGYASAPVVRGPYLTGIIDTMGIAVSFWAWVGLFILIVRRIIYAELRAVTSKMDWVLLCELFIQVGLGVSIAYFYRWGAYWYVYTATPWFFSLFSFHPETATVAPLPWVIKIHYFNAFVIIALFPFTRLVHIFTVPITYLWRPFHVVIWGRAAAVRIKTADQYSAGETGAPRRPGAAAARR